MKKILFYLFIIPATATFAQPAEKFDLFSFSAPADWKKESNESGVSYATENAKTGAFCAIALYKSLPGSSDSKKNFDAAWETVVKEMVKVTSAPAMQAIAKEGEWEVQSGYAPFESNESKGVALLVTTTGYERMCNILILFNSEEYQTAIESFLASVEMKKPAVRDNPVNKQPGNQTVSVGNSGIVKNTTAFNDGWTAKAMEDYVLVTKENTKFYIHYGMEAPANLNRTGESDITQYYWDKFISPRYTVTNLWLNPDVQSIATFNYYAEGTGIEKSTGNSVFIGFRVIIDNGVYYCSEAAAPGKEEYLKHFPNLNMLKDMRGSNRFAVTKQDIIGDWSSSGSSVLQYYNVYTGANAGMTFSSGGQDFFFKSAGTYNARIAGNMGTMGGSQVVFDNKYNGQFTVNDWEITFTKYSGSTTVFTCYYEAVKGGRILHIAKKNAPGVHYPLVKIK